MALCDPKRMERKARGKGQAEPKGTEFTVVQANLKTFNKFLGICALLVR